MTQPVERGSFSGMLHASHARFFTIFVSGKMSDTHKCLVYIQSQILFRLFLMCGEHFGLSG